MFNRILFIIAVIALSGCATPRLLPIEYNGTIAHKSSLPAYVEVNTGRVTGYSSSTMIYASGMFIPITSGPAPSLQFGEKDQKVFLESLKVELVKHNVVSGISEINDGNNLEIIVNFIQTEHFPALQEYRITALLLLKYGEVTGHRKYKILSSDGDSTWRKLNTNALQGKTKVAKKLLDAVIPDIGDFVSSLPR